MALPGPGRCSRSESTWGPKAVRGTFGLSLATPACQTAVPVRNIALPRVGGTHTEVSAGLKSAPQNTAGIIQAQKIAAWIPCNRHRIIVTPIGHPDCRGVRSSPSVYRTIEELDRFVDAMRHAVRHRVG